MNELGVSDAICSSILCLITVVGIAYNIVYAKLLIAAIWYNDVLEERAVYFPNNNVRP